MIDSVVRLRASLRSRLWPLPAIIVVLAVATGLGLPRLDAHLDARLPTQLSDLLFGGDPDAARTLLDAVASSLITVTALTFSLTVVTLQLASSQFSPRLLRTFTRDLFVQTTLALFLGTFAYSLSVLRSVRSDSSTTPASGSGFVPQFSVTLAFVLALASVVMLVLFLAHLTRQIRVESMLATVRADASATALATLHAFEAAPGADEGHTDAGVAFQPPRIGNGEWFTAEAARSGGAAPILIEAPGSGFLTQLDEAALLAAAVEHDLVILIDSYPGCFLVEGTPVGQYWPRAQRDPGDDHRHDLRRRIRDAVHINDERTESQDIGYGLRQLTDVAVRALSPGINDPTTAIHALNHTCVLLCELAGLDLDPHVVNDDQDRVRLVLRRPDLATLLDLALTQPRRYGAADPFVLGRLFTILAELAWHCRASQRPLIALQLERLVATASAQDFDPTEAAGLHELATHVGAALNGNWTTPPAQT